MPVSIKGKEYMTVAERITMFRESHPDKSIQTEIISNADGMVVVRASIHDTDGRTLSTGYAEEDRSKGMINKTSALENCETSAVGRALAFYGFAGGEIASADEVAQAVQQQSAPPKRRIDKKPTDNMRAALYNQLLSAFSEDKDAIAGWLRDYGISVPIKDGTPQIKVAIAAIPDKGSIDAMQADLAELMESENAEA